MFLVLQVYSICGIKAYKISYYNDYGCQICEHDRWEAKQPQADTSSTIKLGNKISQKGPWEKVEIEQLNLMHSRIVKISISYKAKSFIQKNSWKWQPYQ